MFIYNICEEMLAAPAAAYDFVSFGGFTERSVAGRSSSSRCVKHFYRFILHRQSFLNSHHMVRPWSGVLFRDAVPETHKSFLKTVLNFVVYCEKCMPSHLVPTFAHFIMWLFAAILWKFYNLFRDGLLKMWCQLWNMCLSRNHLDTRSRQKQAAT